MYHLSVIFPLFSIQVVDVQHQIQTHRILKKRNHRDQHRKPVREADLLPYKPNEADFPIGISSPGRRLHGFLFMNECFEHHIRSPPFL